MTANTARGITYPTGTDQVAPLHPVFATMATSIDTALGKVIFRPADLTALAAVTGMIAGDVAQVIEGGALFEYDGTSWTQRTPARFASAATRDAAYAKASAAYRVQGAEAYRTDAGWLEQYYALYNSASNAAGATPAGWYPTTNKPYARNIRSAISGSIGSSSYTDLSGSAYWTLQDRSGFAAYNAGWTIPVSGIYRVTTTVQASGNILTGISVDNTAPGLAALRARVTAPPVQSISIAAQTSDTDFVAGNVIRLFGLADSGTPVWSPDPYGGLFSLEFLGPKRF